MRRHRLTNEQATERLQNLKLLHVYGDIGPIQRIHGAGRAWGLQNQGWPEPELAHAVAAGIRAINDPRTDESLAIARSLISEAEYIAFIGFGWMPANVSRLDLKETAKRASAILLTAVGIQDTRPIVAELPAGIPFHIGLLGSAFDRANH